MDSTILTAMSGVLGSFVGASATVATAWVTQKTVNRRELLQAEIRKREALYGEFIAECGKLLVDALTHMLDKPDKLVPIYALINRVRLCSSQPVLAEAEHVLRHITEQYFLKNLTVEELTELARSNYADPLKAFGEACRAELKSMRTHA
jgi:hypothetical protein